MPTNKLELTPEQLERIAKRKALAQRTKVDSEWYAIAEFGKHYGWQAVMAVLNDEINSEQMLMLLEGARMFDKSKLYNETKAVFIGTASTKSKNPSQTFKRMTREIIKGAQPSNE